MELTQLRYFLAVADSLHMTATAEQLHVAQPALSQAISRLENELGVQLFERIGRHLSLTVCGNYLRDKLRAPLATLAAIPDEINEIAENEQKTIRLNVLAASMPTTDAVIAYRREHPDIQFSLLQSTDEKGYDISLTTARLSPASAEDTFVIEEEIFLAVPAKGVYAGREQLGLAEAANENFISLAGTKQLRGICDHYCMQAGFAPQIGFESDNLASVHNLIAAGAGVGFWPAFSFGELQQDAVKLLRLTEPACKRSLILRLHDQRNISHAASVDFFNFLCDYLTKRQAGARPNNN